MTIRTALLLTCFGLFTVIASAQEAAFPNELEGLQFTKQEKLKGLELLVSTRENVIAALGKNCVNGCDYNEDWTVGFAYVNEGWYISKTDNSGSQIVLKPRPEMVGKLASITFRPRHAVMLPVVPKTASGLVCVPAKSSQGTLHFQSVLCRDGEGLAYIVYDETNEVEKFQKNQIHVITYSLPQEKHESIFALAKADKVTP